MQQVSLFLSGERDYTLIKGSTGPLVYPAGHVYIYSLLHNLTGEGRDIPFAQVLFAILYLSTLVVVIACYRRAGAPPYIFPLLVLSKRLHSVFMLRLFNDGIAATALWGTILLLQRRQLVPAAALWSAGVAVKMTLLLVAPAIGVIVLLSAGVFQGVGIGGVALLVQVRFPFIWRETRHILLYGIYDETNTSMQMISDKVALYRFSWLCPSSKKTRWAMSPEHLNLQDSFYSSGR